MCTLNENSKYAENVGRCAINSKTYEENSVNWDGPINLYFEYKIDNWQSNFQILKKETKITICNNTALIGISSNAFGIPKKHFCELQIIYKAAKLKWEHIAIQVMYWLVTHRENFQSTLFKSRLVGDAKILTSNSIFEYNGLMGLLDKSDDVIKSSTRD